MDELQKRIEEYRADCKALEDAWLAASPANIENYPKTFQGLSFKEDHMTRYEMPVPEQDSAWDELDARRDAAAFRAMQHLRDAASEMEIWKRLAEESGDSEERTAIRLDYALRDIMYALKDLGE